MGSGVEKRKEPAFRLRVKLRRGTVRLRLRILGFSTVDDISRYRGVGYQHGVAGSLMVMDGRIRVRGINKGVYEEERRRETRGRSSEREMKLTWANNYEFSDSAYPF
jgi:hypothetical protein